MTTTNFVVKNGITVGTASITASSGNANVGNLGFGTGQITGTGNATVGNLLGVHANGTSNVNINIVNGNVTTSVGGTANVLVVTSTGANIAGTLNTGTGNITTTGNVSAGYLLGNGSQLTGITAASATTAGTVTTNAQPNITSVGTLTSLTVNGLGSFYGTLAAQNSPTVNTQGAWIGWNQSGSTGETNFINQQGGGAGGFNWQSSTTLNARTTLATLTAAGTFTAANIISTSHVVHSVATGISAAGSTQGTATALITDFNVVSTVISGANGVALPTALAGYRITVFNTSANALNVYPLGNGIINSAAANVAFSLPAGDRLDFLCTAAATAPGGQWYTLNATYG